MRLSRSRARARSIPCDPIEAVGVPVNLHLLIRYRMIKHDAMSPDLRKMTSITGNVVAAQRLIAMAPQTSLEAERMWAGMAHNYV